MKGPNTSGSMVDNYSVEIKDESNNKYISISNDSNVSIINTVQLNNIDCILI